MKLFRIATTMMAFVMVVFIFGATGFSTMAGVSLSTGGLTKEDVTSTNEELGSPSAEAYGSDGPSHFGIATGVSDTVDVITTITIGIPTIVQSLGFHIAFGYAVQAMVDFAIGAGLVLLFRGIRP